LAERILSLENDEHFRFLDVSDVSCLFNL